MHLIFISYCLISVAAVSLPQQDSNITARQAAVAAVANQIMNEPRFHVVEGVDTPFPLNPGPIPRNGSLAQSILFQESLLLETNANPQLGAIAQAAGAALIGTMGDYFAVYQQLQSNGLIEIPKSALSFEDPEFAMERLTYKGPRLAQVKRKLSLAFFGLTEVQFQVLCGAKLPVINGAKRFYQEDYSFAATYNDPAAPHKYAPSVVAYYCVNPQQQFRIVAIHVLHTTEPIDLVYTPFDSKDEWSLAKMALNAATINVQQFDHFVECHLVLEPIRVEMFRHMATTHPIYVLLEHHFLQLFANTIAGLTALLSKDTTVDQAFGWGATGALRFLKDELDAVDFQKDFIYRYKADGLNKLPGYKKGKDAFQLYQTIQRFVYEFICKYYHNANDITQDYELQQWLHASSTVSPGFPATVRSRKGLTRILSNIVFRVVVQHHFLNSDATWHLVSFPYSLPSLNAPFPTTKGGTISLQDYVIPNALYVPAIITVASFLRPFGTDISIAQSYDNTILNQVAEDVVTRYQDDLAVLDAKISQREANSPIPFTLLKPTRLPHYVWI